ncbi:MAG: flap endonuclease-1 [Candidatus Diapherotrites archaeon]
MGTAIGELLEKEEFSLEYLEGKLVGVDSFNILYQFLSSIRSYDGTPLMDSKGRVTSHITGLLYRTTNLLQKGIKPIFVFDGEPHILKEETRNERKKIRTDAKEKYEQAKEEGDAEKAKKYAQQSVQLTSEMIEESKKLLQLMGLPVIQAPSEGEAQASHMVAQGKIYGCVSQDYDSLLFGAKRLLRNVTVTGRRKLPGRNVYIDVKPEKIELEKTLQKLGITREKLIWIGILVGTDFNEKFPKVGAKTAVKLVQENNSFEDIIKATNHTPDFDYKEIEELFMKPEFTDDYKIEFNSPDKDAIIKFLCTEHDFSEERVSSALKKIETKLEETGTQSTLDAWG